MYILYILNIIFKYFLSINVYFKYHNFSHGDIYVFSLNNNKNNKNCEIK